MILICIVLDWETVYRRRCSGYVTGWGSNRDRKKRSSCKWKNVIDMYLNGLGDGVAAMLRTGVRISVGERDFSLPQNF